MLDETLLEALAAWLKQKPACSVLVADCGNGESVLRLRERGLAAFGQTADAPLPDAAAYCQSASLEDLPGLYDALLVLHLPPGLNEEEQRARAAQWAVRSGSLWLAAPAHELDGWLAALADAGYYRLAAAGQRSFTLFTAGLTPAAVVREYEDALWELQQTVDRQDGLLAGAGAPLGAEDWTSSAPYWRRKAQVWQHRAETWQARAQFWRDRWQKLEASRTWRTLGLLKRLLGGPPAAGEVKPGAELPVQPGRPAHAGLERAECIRQGQQYAGKRLLFLLPIDGPVGGGNVVVFESQAMQKMGVQVEIFNLERNRAGFLRGYPQLPVPVHFGELADLADLAPQFDAVIATHNSTVEWFDEFPLVQGRPVRAYYIQDFEPLMYAPDSPAYFTALDSYTICEGLLRFTKTEWTRSQVLAHTGAEAVNIGVSLDVDRFQPCQQPADTGRPLRIAAMVRPQTPYRQPRLTLRLLKRAVLAFPGRVEAHIFGTDPDAPQFLTYERDFAFTCHGLISNDQIPDLLGQTDIFVDLSTHQAMGLTALEAMASGCAVIAPLQGGTPDFCRDGVNALLVDTRAGEAAWSALNRLITEDALRNALRLQAAADARQYFPERAALNILDCLFGEL